MFTLLYLYFYHIHNWGLGKKTSLIQGITSKVSRTRFIHKSNKIILFTPLLSLSCSLHLFTPLLSLLFSFYSLFIATDLLLEFFAITQNGSQSLSRFLFVSTNILFSFFQQSNNEQIMQWIPHVFALVHSDQGPCGQRIWGLIKTHFLCCRKVEVGGWNIALWITFTWYRKMVCPATRKSGCLKMPQFQKITNCSLDRNPM